MLHVSSRTVITLAYSCHETAGCVNYLAFSQNTAALNRNLLQAESELLNKARKCTHCCLLLMKLILLLLLLLMMTGFGVSQVSHFSEWLLRGHATGSTLKVTASPRRADHGAEIQIQIQTLILSLCRLSWFKVLSMGIEGVLPQNHCIV